MLKRALSEDMNTVSAYLQTLRLQLNYAKTMTAAFYLHNREAKSELKVNNNDKVLAFCPVPTYVGVKLNKALMYCHHLESLHKNYPCWFCY